MPTRSRGRNPPPSNKEQVTSKTPSCTLLTQRTHSRQTHADTTPHTQSQTHAHTVTHHTHSLHNTILNMQRLRTHARSPKQQTLLAPYEHTGCIAKQANFLTIKCKHKSDCQRIAKQSDCSKKTSCLLRRPHHWGTRCQLRSGAANSPSPNHMSVASISIPRT